MYALTKRAQLFVQLPMLMFDGTNLKANSPQNYWTLLDSCTHHASGLVLVSPDGSTFELPFPAIATNGRPTSMCKKEDIDATPGP